MANVTIPIKRQDYRDAAQISASAPAQYNGWEPGVISGALTGEYITSSDTITIPADFKDHKTVFVIVNADSAAKNVVFKHGNGGAGAKDLTVSAAVGTNLIWLDSAPFVNKATGVITVETNESTASKLSMFGYEMR